MPYSYRVLNANYLNAYTFPGGAMGVTRGILVELDDEAQLAALLGHEIGHVNARHAAQRQGQGLIAQVAVSAIAAAADARWQAVTAIAGQIGASALLASYSRENEREADALGQQYMVRAGYPASGMVGLQGLLLKEAKEKPSLLETMFSSHPLTSERHETARRLAHEHYAASLSANPGRERFMDRTASLRAKKPAIDACKEGETALAKKRLDEAGERFGQALRFAPEDYPANLLMAKCLAAQGKQHEALRYAEAARQVYPQEAQAAKLVGSLKLALREPEAAYAAFDQFDRLLPGDPGIAFLKGASMEAAGNRQVAARHYQQFLKTGATGGPAEYAKKQLKAWGMLR